MAEKPTISVIEPLKTDLAEAEPARREEFFLDAIAGGTNGETLEPMDRPEEFLRRIAERETYQEGEINRVYDQIPVVPEAGDVGKVLTVVAGGEGEAPKWGAEAVKIPEPEKIRYHYAQVLPLNSTKVVEIPVPAGIMDTFIALFLDTPTADRQRFMQEHVKIQYAGALSQITIVMDGYRVARGGVSLTYPAILDGAVIPVEVYIGYIFDTNAKTLKFNAYKICYNASGAEVSPTLSSRSLNYVVNIIY